MSGEAQQWMERALELAERGRGLVEPNPLVGAVVVRDGKIVGEGWHQRFGGPHAEVFALNQAGEQARGATLSITLEPCCHHGKTPPCTDAIMKAGIARVVAAMSDPFPQVAGGGVAKLTAAGIPVEVGLGETAARRLNAPYLKLLATGRPYVHAKWAMTLDGKIATRSGDSKWISNEASRRLVHQLRGRMDAIIVGSGTALADDPLLTVRPPGPRTPVRIVLDSQARLPATSRLAQTAREAPVFLAVARKNENAEALRALGCEVFELADANGRVALTALLEELGRRRLTNVLVEGGAGVLASFLEAGEIDECHVFIAPALVGGSAAKTPVGGVGFDRIAQALKLRDVHVEMIEEDVYIRARKIPPGI
jgi:diaminohydroxyphosphoribosylaminopyrimidine deaminase/5-amino-6-(5-phosphoribosylamino)uracil reductase